MFAHHCLGCPPAGRCVTFTSSSFALCKDCSLSTRFRPLPVFLQDEMHYFALNILVPRDQHWLIKLGGTVTAAISSLGGIGVMILAIADSSFLTVPEGNDLLIVLLSTGKSWKNMAYYVSMTVLGSVIGCLLLYSLGRKGGSPLLRRRFAQSKIDRAEMLFKKFGILTVLIPSILPPPLPFKIFVLSAGVFRLNAFVFLAAVLVGRTIRYSMWGILAVLYGNAVKVYMQENLNLVGTILLVVFGVILTVVAVFLIRKLKAGNLRMQP